MNANDNDDDDDVINITEVEELLQRNYVVKGVHKQKSSKGVFSFFNPFKSNNNNNNNNNNNRSNKSNEYKSNIKAHNGSFNLDNLNEFEDDDENDHDDDDDDDLIIFNNGSSSSSNSNDNGKTQAPITTTTTTKATTTATTTASTQSGKKGRNISNPLTINVPKEDGISSFLAHIGPGILVSVAYIDPGNFATNIEAGSEFGYELIWVLALSTIFAFWWQMLSVRLALVTRKDLAQVCRYEIPHLKIMLWLTAEISVISADMAELIGAAFGLNMLFGIPTTWGIVITSFDSLIFLMLQNYGIRKLEIFIGAIVLLISICFIIETALVKPNGSLVLSGFIPHLQGDSLYSAIAIIGATIMPHNLFLHSSLVLTRTSENNAARIRKVIFYNGIESGIALLVTFGISLTIIVISAAEFFENGIKVYKLQQAADLLKTTLNTKLAAIAFGLALFLAGEASTITGTYAGQIIMEGFLKLKITPWKRRLITRSVAIIPALLVSVLVGDSGAYQLLIISQIILSFQLPFAIIPLVKFTNDKDVMGDHVNSKITSIFAWCSASFLIIANLLLVLRSIAIWIVSLERNYAILATLATGIVICLYFFAMFLLLFANTDASDKIVTSCRKSFLYCKRMVCYPFISIFSYSSSSSSSSSFSAPTNRKVQQVFDMSRI